jgi:CTD kinase subunit beta
MAPAQPSQTPASGQVNDPSTTSNGPSGSVGPHASFIYVAKRFIFQQQIQTHMIAIGNNPTREDNFRLQGVQWINDVRKALSLYAPFPKYAHDLY